MLIMKTLGLRKASTIQTPRETSSALLLIFFPPLLGYLPTKNILHPRTHKSPFPGRMMSNHNTVWILKETSSAPSSMSTLLCICWPGNEECIFQCCQKFPFVFLNGSWNMLLLESFWNSLPWKVKSTQNYW